MPYSGNITERKAKRKAYNEANKEKINARRKQYRKNNKEKIKLNEKNKWLKRKYGITLKERNVILKKQNNKCKICFYKFNENEFKSIACVDHCHTTNKIRGLLCRTCNAGLGYFKDNIETLTKVITYLEEAV